MAISKMFGRLGIVGPLAIGLIANGSAQMAPDYPAVFQAVPNKAAIVLNVNLDLSESNPVFQSIVSDLLSQGLGKMPINPQFLRYGLQMALQSANIPNAAGIANGLDLNVAVAVFNPADPSIASLKDPILKPNGEMQKGKELQTILTCGAIVVHDSAASQAKGSLDHLVNSNLQPNWWLGTKYYTVANGSSKFSFMIDGDYLVIGKNPRLFHYFTDAIERGQSIAKVPAFAGYAKSRSPFNFVSLLVANSELEKPLKAPFFSERWRAFNVAATPTGLEVAAYGSKLVTSAKDPSVGNNDVNSLFRALPAGRMISLALSVPGFMLGDVDSDEIPMAIGIYPGYPNEKGVPTGGDIVVVSNQKDEKPSKGNQGITSMVEALTGRIAKSDELQEAKSAVDQGEKALGGIVGTALSNSSSLFHKLFKGKDLLLKKVNGKAILSTSDELMESAEKIANQVAPSAKPVTNRLIGLLSLEPIMLASVLDGMGANGKPAMGLPAEIELLMKSATGPVTLRASTEQDFDTVTLSLPLNWSVVKQLVEKVVIGKSK